ncbi:hypothetical protein L1987_74023 [Smallanthus sonchifolius]|uniref:Uncharacterized protein n=1 Tax=Smallanthus sonchifolius TaxID=185202 RepID=A0ACB9A1T3_9ASTR|nr:hypothetical protein L1987_74023 [Smallanthus sonchifolius]
MTLGLTSSRILSGFFWSLPYAIVITFKLPRTMLKRSLTGKILHRSKWRSRLNRLVFSYSLVVTLRRSIHWCAIFPFHVPVDLVIDHSVQVDVARSANAVQANMDLEFQRNNERFAFLKWGSHAFDNMLVVPPGSGIVHQVNLEYLGRVVFNTDGILYILIVLLD